MSEPATAADVAAHAILLGRPLERMATALERIAAALEAGSPVERVAVLEQQARQRTILPDAELDRPAVPPETCPACDSRDLDRSANPSLLCRTCGHAWIW